MDTPWTEAITDTRTLDDDTAGELAICEAVQRAAWARERGLDPRDVDLVALAA